MQSTRWLLLSYRAHCREYVVTMTQLGFNKKLKEVSVIDAGRIYVVYVHVEISIDQSEAGLANTYP